MNPSITKNENCTYIYFTYNHSTKIIQIIGTYVTSEFPSLIILPLFMIAILLATILYRKKLRA